MAGATMYPKDLKYTKDHEWLKVDGAEATVGITDFAQNQLGDVVFIDLPDIGKVVAKGDVFGTIESVKAASELFAPVSGEVIAVNEQLTVHPELVNKQPHESWMIRLRPTNPSDADTLLDAAAYVGLTQ